MYLDAAFVGELAPVADLAALAMTGLASAGPALQKAGFDHGEALGRALASGARHLPPFRFELQSVQDPSLRAAAEHLSPHVLATAVAWAVLHEVGHHRLGHLKRNPTSLAESRAWELAADQWAFEHLDRLGYSLLAVQTFFGAKAVLEQIRELAGVGIREERSTHPSFATRADSFARRWSTSRAPRGPFLVLTTLQQSVEGRTQIIETWVPRARDEGHLMAVHQLVFDGAPLARRRPAMLVLQWRGNELILYGREGPRLTEWIIRDPESVYPRIAIRERTVGSAAVSESSTAAIQLGTSLAQDMLVSSIPAYRLLETTPRSLIRRALQEARLRPGVIASAEAIQMEMLAAVHDVLIRYTRGELDSSQAQRGLLAATRAGAGRLRTLIGEQAYARVQGAVFASPAVQIAGEVLPSLVPR